MSMHLGQGEDIRAGNKDSPAPPRPCAPAPGTPPFFLLPPMHLRTLPPPAPPPSPAHLPQVDIVTPLDSERREGAVCEAGEEPQAHLRKGTGGQESTPDMCLASTCSAQG